MKSVRVIATLALLPSLALPAPASARAHRPAPASWIVLDNATGEVLSAHDADLPLYPASLTKMLTAQVVLDHARLQDRVVISSNAANAPADHMRWPAGKTFTVEQLLYGMMLMSSNGAAIAVAEHVAGTERNFTSLMQFKARGLGVTQSAWTTPEGLDARGQLATARDLATIARNLLTYPILAKIVRTREYELRWPGGTMNLRSRNHFLFNYPGAIGIKPGFTTRAEGCLAAAARRDGRTVIAVVMRTPSPTADAAALLDAAFAKTAPQRTGKRLRVSFVALAKPAAEAARTVAAPFRPAGDAAVPLALAVYLGVGTLLCVAGVRVIRRRRAG